MTTHPNMTRPPLPAQGQTWEETTVGSAFRTAARTIAETDLITFVTSPAWVFTTRNTVRNSRGEDVLV